MGLLCQSETAFLPNTGQSKCHTDSLLFHQGSRYRSPLSPFAQKNKIWHKNHKLAKTSGEKDIA